MKGANVSALTLNDVTRIAAAGRSAAEETGTAMNIAIVDAGGHLLHFTRMDDAWLGSVDLALKKAKTSVLFSMPSATLSGISQPGGPVYGIEHSNGGLISFGGGLPIVDADGRTVGTVGVSGGTVDQDVHVAGAAARAY
ncbi:heme-binding protein [Streptomyces mobaraensis]|uniref:Heme-binding protein n=1 Tax=Streptomyces mobaraensis TaxID=35621 RepID=A0A5N5WAM2_STRMB|nr:heme-binding protein [Streptomyces mobaraensis]